MKYQPSGARGTRNARWPLGGPKMADGVWGSRGFGRSKLLLLNKFSDPSTPSMRKVDDEEEKKRKRENNDVYSGH